MGCTPKTRTSLLQMSTWPTMDQEEVPAQEPGDGLRLDITTRRLELMEPLTKRKQMMGKGPEEIEKQLERLAGMMGKKMKKNLKKWLGQRIKILSELKKGDADTTHDEL